jgi:hypothetical protein
MYKLKTFLLQDFPQFSMSGLYSTFLETFNFLPFHNPALPRCFAFVPMDIFNGHVTGAQQ